MKMKIAVLALILCVASASTAFARGGYSHHGGGYNHGYYRGGHHNDGLGIAVGVMGGLILGSALMYSAAPPQTVVYGSSYTTYQPEVVVRQPGICIEERRVAGEWRISQFDGRQVWVSYPYPMLQRVQVPCY
jgi:hypothetical protein